MSLRTRKLLMLYCAALAVGFLGGAFTDVLPLRFGLLAGLAMVLCVQLLYWLNPRVDSGNPTR